MTLLLTILKVIGIIFLVILGILLAAVLLVLFVPVRYRAEGAYQDRFWTKGQVTWLLHLLSIRFSFDNGFQYSVTIAGIRFLPRRKKEKASDAEKEVLPDNEPSDEAAETPSSDRISEKQKANTKEPKTPETDNTDAERTSDPAADRKEPQPSDSGRTNQTDGMEEDTAEHLCFWEKLLSKIYAIFRKYREKYEAICAKIKQIQDKLSYYIRILKREETKELLRLIIDQLQGVIRHVLPKKLDVRLHIGTGDPASTGQLLALHGMLYPITGRNVVIVPDFEEKHLEGAFHMKGRITAFVLLLCALRVIINKNFRKLIRILRKKEEA